MDCIGMGAARLLANVFRSDTQSFTATWSTAATPPVVVHRSPTRASPHWRAMKATAASGAGSISGFEIDASDVSCAQVADYVLDHCRQRRRDHQALSVTR